MTVTVDTAYVVLGFIQSSFSWQTLRLGLETARPSLGVSDMKHEDTTCSLILDSCTIRHRVQTKVLDSEPPRSSVFHWIDLPICKHYKCDPSIEPCIGCNNKLKEEIYWKQLGASCRASAMLCFIDAVYLTFLYSLPLQIIPLLSVLHFLLFVVINSKTIITIINEQSKLHRFPSQATRSPCALFSIYSLMWPTPCWYWWPSMTHLRSLLFHLVAVCIDQVGIWLSIRWMACNIDLWVKDFVCWAKHSWDCILCAHWFRFRFHFSVIRLWSHRC